jgi:hypothetical protein
MAESMPDQSTLIRLRRVLTETFSENELRTLCFDLGMDYEGLPGTGKEGKVREFVAHVNRRQAIAELVDIVRRLRPDIAWGDVPGAPSSPPFQGYQTPRERAEVLFSEATRRQFHGDVGYALQLCRQIKQIDPTYPRIDVTIAELERELQPPYIDAAGRAQPRDVLSQHTRRLEAPPAPGLRLRRAIPYAGALVALGVCGCVSLLIPSTLFASAAGGPIDGLEWLCALLLVLLGLTVVAAVIVFLVLRYLFEGRR